MSGDHDNRSADPIFIVGMNGSGTTMLLDHLNSHHLVYGFREETRILPHLLCTRNDSAELSSGPALQRLWADMCGVLPFWKVNKRSAVPIPEDWRDRGRNPAEIFDYILTYFALQEGKSIWCEKTPMYALHIKLLSDNFPTARFIHMIRDGRDCAASFHRRWGYSPSCSMYRWKKTVEAARFQGQLIKDRYREVVFEELTSRPEKVMRRLCAYLSIDFEDELLYTSRSAKRVRGTQSERIIRNSGTFRAYFKPREISKLDNIGGMYLHHLGYQTDNPRGNGDPNLLYLWYRQTVDDIKRFAEILRSAGTRDNPWKRIWGRINGRWSQRMLDRRTMLKKSVSFDVSTRR